jgi:hypothetical protein
MTNKTKFLTLFFATWWIQGCSAILSQKSDSSEQSASEEETSEVVKDDSGAEVIVPPGTLDVNQVKITEGKNLSEGEAFAALGLPEDSQNASNPLVLAIDDVEAQKQSGSLTIRLPIEDPQGASLADPYQFLIIVYHVMKPDGTITFGYIIRSGIEITDGFASFTSLGVGTYQAIYVTVNIPTPKEVTTSHPIDTGKGDQGTQDPGATQQVADPKKSTITAAGSVGLGQKASVTIKLLDATGKPIVGVKPEFAATGTGVQITQNCSATNKDGISKCLNALGATATGDKILKMTSPIPLTGGKVHFYILPVDTSKSTITAAGDLIADAHDAKTVQITLKNAAGNGISGVTPTFSANNNAIALQNCSETNSAGVSTCSNALRASKAGTITLSLTSPTSFTGATVKALDYKGYHARACGFDMNRNGIIGEPADCKVCDGVTTDPDEDGLPEDIIYIDTANGNDGNTGTPENPFATIAAAVTYVNANGTGEEDILCLSGTDSSAALDISGKTGTYTIGGISYPEQPAMLVGWDKNGNGSYPPFDTLDTAVLSGALDLDSDDVDYFELGHVTLSDISGNAIDARDPSANNHLHFHDLRLHNINQGVAQNDSKHAVLLGGSNIVFENSELINFGSFGIKHQGGTQQNLYFNHIHGEAIGASANPMLFFKFLGGTVDNLTIQNSILDGKVSIWNGGTAGAKGLSIEGGYRSVRIRDNDFKDMATPIYLDPSTNPSQSTDNVTIERNLFEISSMTSFKRGVHVDVGGASANSLVENFALLNNVFTAQSGQFYTYTVYLDLTNSNALPTGMVKVIGNTLTAGSATNYGFYIGGSLANDHPNFLFFNNITHNYKYPVYVQSNPTNFVGGGNVYHATTTQYFWNNGSRTFAQFINGSNANTTGDQECSPTFVDAANQDFHLDTADTCAKDMGQDISSYLTIDKDSKPRSAANPDAGAFAAD